MTPKTPKVKIYRTKKNTVNIKINFGTDGGFRYYRRDRKYIKLNRDDDWREYPYVLTRYDLLHRFLDVNNIDERSVEIDPESVDYFYGYPCYNGFRFFVDLTKSKIDEWWGFDIPTLTRYVVNKKRKENGWGIYLICWEHCLVESSLHGVFLGDDITLDELKAISKGREHTSIGEECQAFVKALSLSSEQIRELHTFVKDYEARIQKVIDQHTEQIISPLIGTYLDITYIDGKPVYQEKIFGFDCGFLFIHSRNPKYDEAKRILYNARKLGRYNEEDIYRWMDIRLPFQGQSVTVATAVFNECKKVVQQALGEQLYCTTMLD